MNYLLSVYDQPFNGWLVLQTEVRAKRLRRAATMLRNLRVTRDDVRSRALQPLAEVKGADIFGSGLQQVSLLLLGVVLTRGFGNADR